VMDLNGLGQVLDVNAVRPDTDAKQKVWDKCSREVYSRLILTTSGVPQGIVKKHRGKAGDEAWKLKNGHEAWKELVTKYEQKGEVKMTALHHELLHGEMRSHEDPEKYFLRLEEIRCQLQELQVVIDDNILKGIVTSKMPAEYNPLLAVIDTKKGLKYDELKDWVRDYYLRAIAGSKDMDSENDDACAFYAFNGRCHKCGQRGHRKSACKNERVNWKKNIICHGCGKPGHFKYECGKETSNLVISFDDEAY